MSDTNESSRQATHAKQEGVDDNIAATAGPVVAGSDTANDAGAASDSTEAASGMPDAATAGASATGSGTVAARSIASSTTSGTTPSTGAGDGASLGATSWSSAVNAASGAASGAASALKTAGDSLSGRWVAAAGMGIGSAALVAALLYANRGPKGDKGR